VLLLQWILAIGSRGPRSQICVRFSAASKTVFESGAMLDGIVRFTMSPRFCVQPQSRRDHDLPETVVDSHSARATNGDSSTARLLLFPGRLHPLDAVAVSRQAKRPEPDGKMSPGGYRFCSWLALCPGNKISGGKVLDSRTRQVVDRVADALRLAAQSTGRTESCLGIFYRRKQAHLGAPKATTATARKLARLIYHLLKHKQPFQEPDPALYQLRLRKAALTKLQRQATALGYTLLPTAPVPA
jgi:hypothetical protein